MLRLTDAQRAVLVQAFPAFGHLAAGTLVFGQFIRQQPFSVVLALSSMAIWIVFVCTTLFIAGGKQ